MRLVSFEPAVDAIDPCRISLNELVCPDFEELARSEEQLVDLDEGLQEWRIVTSSVRAPSERGCCRLSRSSTTAVGRVGDCADPRR